SQGWPSLLPILFLLPGGAAPAAIPVTDPPTARSTGTRPGLRSRMNHRVKSAGMALVREPRRRRTAVAAAVVAAAVAVAAARPPLPQQHQSPQQARLQAPSTPAATRPASTESTRANRGAAPARLAASTSRSAATASSIHAPE